MGEMELPTSPPPGGAAAAVLQVVFVDGERSVDLGTVTVQPSLGVRKLQAVVADRVGVAPQQISASLARPRRQRRVPLDEGADLAAAVAREGAGCYVLATLRRSRRDRRGGRSRRDRKAAGAVPGAGAGSPPLLMAPTAERTILKRLPSTDLASLAAGSAVGFGGWDYEAQLRELQRQHEWYMMSTASPDPYLLPPLLDDPLPSPAALWPARPSTPCPDCEAAAALGLREPAFHWCVRDAVTVGFRSPVGPIERPSKRSPASSPSPTPSPPPPTRLPPFLHPGLTPLCY